MAAKPPSSVVRAPTPSTPRNMKIEFGEEPDFVSGRLQRVYEDRPNYLTSFVHDKLHPMQSVTSDGDSTGRVWRPTARRYDVVLPDSAPEMYVDVRLLVEAAEREMREDQYDLLVAVKVTFPKAAVMHQSWEQARLFARHIAIRFGVAVIVVQHVPALSGSKNPALHHAHVMILPRQLEAIGSTSFCEVTTAGGHSALAAMWRTCRGEVN